MHAYLIDFFHFQTTLKMSSESLLVVVKSKSKGLKVSRCCFGCIYERSLRSSHLSTCRHIYVIQGSKIFRHSCYLEIFYYQQLHRVFLCKGLFAEMIWKMSLCNYPRVIKLYLFTCVCGGRPQSSSMHPGPD